jgi:hypothetical protein
MQSSRVRGFSVFAKRERAKPWTLSWALCKETRATTHLLLIVGSAIHLTLLLLQFYTNISELESLASPGAMMQSVCVQEEALQQKRRWRSANTWWSLHGSSSRRDHCCKFVFSSLSHSSPRPHFYHDGQIPGSWDCNDYLRSSTVIVAESVRRRGHRTCVRRNGMQQFIKLQNVRYAYTTSGVGGGGEG